MFLHSFRTCSVDEIDIWIQHCVFPRLTQFQLALSDEFELELLTHAMEIHDLFYGVGLIDLWCIAFELGERTMCWHTLSTSRHNVQSCQYRLETLFHQTCRVVEPLSVNKTRKQTASSTYNTTAQDVLGFTNKIHHWNNDCLSPETPELVNEKKLGTERRW